MSDTNYQKAAIAFLTYGIGDFLECDKTKQALDCFGTIEDEKILKKAEILTAGFELKSNSNQKVGLKNLLSVFSKIRLTQGEENKPENHYYKFETLNPQIIPFKKEKIETQSNKKDYDNLLNCLTKALNELVKKKDELCL